MFHAGKSNCIFLHSSQNHSTWMLKQQCFWDDFSHLQVCLYLHILLLIRCAFLDVDIAVKDFGLPAYTWSQALPPATRDSSQSLIQPALKSAHCSHCHPGTL